MSEEHVVDSDDMSTRAGSAEEPEPAEKGTEPGFTVVDRRFWARSRDDGDDAQDDEEGRPKKPTYVEALERQLQDKTEQLETTLSRHREAIAEFNNARTRLQRDVAMEAETGKRHILADLLEVLDNLERAMEAGEQADDGKSLLAGVGLVRDQFLAKLENLGVTREDPFGAAFDPARHEAVSTVPVHDRAQDGRVVGVIRACYLIGGETLRPAMVAVGQASDG